MIEQKPTRTPSLNFETVREEWSTYTLDDNSTLRIKALISNIIEGDPEKGGLKINFNIASFKEAVQEDKGIPSENQVITPEDVIGDISYKLVQEKMNIYDVLGKYIILVLPKLLKVGKTEKFNSEGNRLYQFDITAVVNIMKYPLFPPPPEKS